MDGSPIVDAADSRPGASTVRARGLQDVADGLQGRTGAEPREDGAVLVAFVHVRAGGDQRLHDLE